MALTGRTFIFRIAAAVLLLHVSVSAAAAQAGRPAGTSRHSVTISTEPGAKIWVDGVLYGTASKSGTLKLTNLTPTRKTIRVRADGFKELQKAVVPTQAEQISLSLTKTTDEAELAFQEAERFATVDRAKAVQAYQRALKMRPGYAEAHIGLARLYTETGEVDKAEKAITAARRAKPGLAEVSAIEGRIFKGVDEEAKAIASFKRAIREGSGFQPEAYAGLGILYKEKAEGFGAAGDYDREAANYAESAKHLSTAIKQLGGAPDAVVLYQFLGLVYEQQKKPEKAIAVYEEFLKAFPDHPESAAFESFIVQLKKEAARQN
jgi:tetratricopeptide (TPR) repeat protein